jgi:hypothetical protein
MKINSKIILERVVELLKLTSDEIEILDKRIFYKKKIMQYNVEYKVIHFMLKY